MPKAVADTNALVAMVDGHDTWHVRTEKRIERLEREQSDIQRLYIEIIALKCGELNIDSILSFDRDVDQIDWVTRIS